MAFDELRGVKPVWGEVVCLKHGISSSDPNRKQKYLQVAVAKNRKEKFLTGCPRCKRENGVE